MKLAHPFEFKKQKVMELNLRRPKVKDTLIAQKMATSDEDQEIFMMANLADVEPDLIHELDLADYQKLQKVFQGFLS